MSEIRENEVSWKIDLISEINIYLNSINKIVDRAGGEQTIKGINLFPDVLLFNKYNAVIQGWELKMPDTQIDDKELLANAEKKARTLKLDSFLVWNLSVAKLYIKKDNKFIEKKAWTKLDYIKNRKELKDNKEKWVSLVKEIIDYINDMLNNKELIGRNPVEIFKDGRVINVILEYSDVVKIALDEKVKEDPDLDAQINLIDTLFFADYGKEINPIISIAQYNLINWVSKFIFANIIEKSDDRVSIINKIDHSTSPIDALKIFEKISGFINFNSIFGDSAGLKYIPPEAWAGVISFNNFIKTIRIGELSQEQISEILENIADQNTKRVRGQYVTPEVLANLISLQAINDKNDLILDPCCGSGTILKKALEIKMNRGVPAVKAAEQIFGNDKDPAATQLSTLALFNMKLMGIPLLISNKDAFELKKDKELTYKHPKNGSELKKKLENFDSIISNLPMIGFNQNKNSNARIYYKANIEKSMVDFDLPEKLDLSNYLMFNFYNLLKPKGILAVFISNGWLNPTSKFYDLISKKYDILKVITSGKGRWFSSDVVANILILRKKEQKEISPEIQFITLNKHINELSDKKTFDSINSQIRLGKKINNDVDIEKTTISNLNKFRTYGLGGNAQFVNRDWVLKLPLRPLSDFFSKGRGDRRGLDDMFYPKKGHGIENDYLYPNIKSPRELSGIVATPSSEVFSCSKSISELKSLGHYGAINWINKFNNPSNIKKLKASSEKWYEMSTNRIKSIGNFLLPIAYDKRLCTFILDHDSFINQRFMILEPKEKLDSDLFLALLNSSIHMFFIEGMGFPRALGALDTNSTTQYKYLQLLDPSKLDNNKISDLKKAFEAIKKRPPEKDLLNEIDQEDRKRFDQKIIDVFNLEVNVIEIHNSLKRLYQIRKRYSI